MRRPTLFALALVGCHLADDPDPPKCPEGSHPELDRCVADDVTELAVTIADDCTLTPETLTVKSGELFQFNNTDDVAHEIRGTSDGEVWANVPPRKRTPLTSIAKQGAWAYTVSGCPKGGVVKVE